MILFNCVKRKSRADFVIFLFSFRYIPVIPLSLSLSLFALSSMGRALYKKGKKHILLSGVEK